MNSTNIFFGPLPNQESPNTKLTRNNLLIRVKELSERDRRSLLLHFLALSDDDRLLRFGSIVSDEFITKYAQKLNFTRDSIFGVYNHQLELVGAGHLSFTPREALSIIASITTKKSVAEFGLSVSETARGIGIGKRLFERAAMHCRNGNIDTLYMHCLECNPAMKHIAKKAGLEIHPACAEADAYLKLPPPSSVSILQEAFDEQTATLDFTFKMNSHLTVKWIENFFKFKPRS